MRGCSLLGYLASLALLSTTAVRPDEVMRSQAKESPIKTRQACLDVGITKEGEDWRVTVALRNTGDVPLVVDRDLVMGIAVEAYGPDGSRIREEPGPATQPATKEEPRKRPAALPPGESLSRTLSLKQGWRVLEGGQGIDSQQRTIAVTGYEEIVRLPEGARPCRITVSYGRTAQFWDHFLGYTGLSPKEAGLYLGPLEQTVEVVEEP